jgi:hypothetical protein
MISTQKSLTSGKIINLQDPCNQSLLYAENEVEKMLPMVILFVNEEDEGKVDLEYISNIFDAECTYTHDAEESGLEDFDGIVFTLAQYAFDTDKVKPKKVILLCNANEEGFNTTRHMGYFNHQYILKNAAEHYVMHQINDAYDKHKCAQTCAQFMEIKLSDIYEDMNEVFSRDGITKDIMSAAMAPIIAVINAHDLLGSTIKKMIESFRRA